MIPFATQLPNSNSSAIASHIYLELGSSLFFQPCLLLLSIITGPRISEAKAFIYALLPENSSMSYI